MSPDLSTFAKVRALHDRTDSPGEKAAAAGRMEALARAAGMSVAEAMSKLDAQTSRAAAGADWSDLADAFRRAEAATAAANGPEAPCQRRGLPIYDPNKVECWRDVAEHCWQLDWIIPKAHGGKFLTKAERARLKALARHYGPVKNSTADWLETILARCHAARQSWRDRGKGGARPDRKATESDIEKAAELVAAAKRREASKLDTPEPEPQTRGPAKAFAESFAEFMNRPDFVAERNEREARRRVAAAAIIEQHGSEDALFEDTPLEAALRAACEPMLGPGETWSTSYRLDDWDWIGATMPESVRAAVARGWPLPETVTQAWAEFEAADRLNRERWTVEPNYDPHLYVRARQEVVEEICNTLPARSLNDLRARGAWLAFQANAEVEQHPDKHRTLIATLRADIERMGARLREQDAAGVQYGQDSSPDHHPAPEMASVQSGHAQGYAQSAYPSRRSNADKRRDVLALLNVGEAHNSPLTDREIARRVGVSPTTVGTIRRSLA